MWCSRHDDGVDDGDALGVLYARESRGGDQGVCWLGW